MGKTVPPTTLLVDLDGVLRLWPKDYADLERMHNLREGSLAAVAFEPSLIEQAVTGRITDREWRNRIVQRLAILYPRSKAEEAVAAWSRPFGAVQPEVLGLVVRARSRCAVGLLTNATDRLPRDLEELGLVNQFDFVVNSSDVGFSKPDSKIFQHALAVAGARAAETVFVDDTASNVSAAHSLGMRSHLFSSATSLETFLRSVALLPSVA